MKTRWFFLWMTISMTFLFAACNDHADANKDKTKDGINTEKTSEPSATGKVTLTEEEFEGMKLFMYKCNKCHPGGEKGKGPALNDKEFPNFLIHWQVRIGLGDMPKFTDEEISKEQLHAITAFVKRMQAMTKG